MTTEGPISPAASSPRRGRGRYVAVLAVAIIAAIVVASLGFVPQPFSSGSSSSTSSPFSSSSSSFLVSSSASSTANSSLSINSTGSFSLCSNLTAAQEESNAKVTSGGGAGVPNYDEQLLLGFQQNFTSLSFNVTLRALNDSFGFGAAYLLNGLTDSGYWYQVGIAWNLGEASGMQYIPGFRFVYEVWSTATATSVFPLVSGTLPKAFFADDGDVVLLSLNMTADGQVSMAAFDWNTSASSSTQYSSFGASQFLGFKNKLTGYPTSLLTEWYHVLPYVCSAEPVIYSNSQITLSSAWLRIDEWNLTGVSSSQRFNSNGQCCVFAAGYQVVNLQAPPALASLAANGTAIYANSNEFITP